jgi:peroxiredoxin
MIVVLTKELQQAMGKAADPTRSTTIGQKTPAFRLPHQSGKKQNLADYKGKWVVLYWYPRDSTPGFIFTHERPPTNCCHLEHSTGAYAWTR